MPWTNPIDYIVGQSASADYTKLQERILDNLDFAGSHGHSGSAGDGTYMSPSALRGDSSQQCTARYIAISPFFPNSKSSGNINVARSGIVGYGYHQIENVLGASVNYIINIAEGTWSITTVYIGNNGSGSISVGGVDMYRGSDTPDIKSDASTFTISASGTYTLKFTSTGSNVLSGGYFGNLQHVELRRLSA